MTSKILLTADWHLTDNPRDEYRHEWQEELRQIVMNNNIGTVFLLGDITEEKDRHSSVLVNRVVRHLNHLSDYCHIKILLGNHDYSQMGSPYWEFLNCVPHIEFFKDNYVWQDILLLPHTRNWKRDWDINTIKKHKLIFAHNTFDGAKVGHGASLGGIPTDIFAPGTKVFAGDVHVPQELGPVTYIGSPYTINFGDEFTPRVLLLEGTKVTPIYCKSSQKMVVYFEYNKDNLKSKANRELIPGDIVQARVYIHRNDYVKWAEIVERVHKWGELEQVKVFQVKPEIEGGTVSMKSTKTNTNKRTDSQIYSDYAKRMGIDEETVQIGEKFL